MYKLCQNLCTKILWFNCLMMFGLMDGQMFVAYALVHSDSHGRRCPFAFPFSLPLSCDPSKSKTKTEILVFILQTSFGFTLDRVSSVSSRSSCQCPVKMSRVVNSHDAFSSLFAFPLDPTFCFHPARWATPPDNTP